MSGSKLVLEGPVNCGGNGLGAGSEPGPGVFSLSKFGLDFGRLRDGRRGRRGILGKARPVPSK
jgi:hypothetical protein